MTIKKGKQCEECFNNKTKVIRDDETLLNWLNAKGFKRKISKIWLARVKDDGHIQFFWCSRQEPFRPTLNPLWFGKNYKRTLCPKIIK